MFYEPKKGHGLQHNPFNSIVSPRPIGWISTRSKDGQDNLAPYSFFNATAYVPPQVMFASTGRKPDQGDTKDTVQNIRDTGVFCVNIVSHALMNAMNASSETLPREVDEFAHAGLDKAACDVINCARVAAAPAALECEMTQIIPQRGENNFLIMGEVIGIHMQDDCIVDGLFDVTKFTPLTRLGYKNYSTIDHVFELKRPDEA